MKLTKQEISLILISFLPYSSAGYNYFGVVGSSLLTFIIQVSAIIIAIQSLKKNFLNSPITYYICIYTSLAFLVGLYKSNLLEQFLDSANNIASIWTFFLVSIIVRSEINSQSRLLRTIRLYLFSLIHLFVLYLVKYIFSGQGYGQLLLSFLPFLSLPVVIGILRLKDLTKPIKQIIGFSLIILFATFLVSTFDYHRGQVRSTIVIGLYLLFLSLVLIFKIFTSRKIKNFLSSFIPKKIKTFFAVIIVLSTSYLTVNLFQKSLQLTWFFSDFFKRGGSLMSRVYSLELFKQNYLDNPFQFIFGISPDYYTQRHDLTSIPGAEKLPIGKGIIDVISHNGIQNIMVCFGLIGFIFIILMALDPYLTGRVNTSTLIVFTCVILFNFINPLALPGSSIDVSCAFFYLLISFRLIEFQSFDFKPK